MGLRMPEAARSGAAEGAARGLVIETARALGEMGLSAGTSGNVSQRCQDGFLITPSALPYGEMQADDIVFVAADGSPSGARRSAAKHCLTLCSTRCAIAAPASWPTTASSL